MRIPLTMLGGLVGYFIWASTFAGASARML
jgi:hypothetical protein